MTLRPPSLATLLKHVTRLFAFPPDEPAQTLYDEEGDLILSIDDVLPGATIYVSQIADPANDPETGQEIAKLPIRDSASTGRAPPPAIDR
jgi:hypothetical protein